MSAFELNCQWHFAELGENAGDEGPNSAMSQTFSQFPCSALVRESIQNSLDAVVDTSKPVKVCFNHREFEKSDYPQFFKLQDSIKDCLNYYCDNVNAKRIYPKMIQYIKDNERIGYIRVEDFNTKGMTYDPNNKSTTFYAFVRSAGVSVKEAEGAGGSFGFGKAAFFVMSPINTIIVSTKNINNECFFEGVTRLCTHKTDGKKRSHMGFYDNNGGQPTSNPDLIPKPFKRDETGTSIGITGVGFDEWSKSKEEIVKEVLRNFFVAIMKEKLVVIVDGSNSTDKGAITINADNLDNLMTRYFPNLRDVRRGVSYNPRPYYEAIKENAIHLEGDLPILGHVHAYFKEVSENATGVIYMRKLFMKVNKLSRNLGNYNGVFICENNKGNIILGDMENPEHNEWEAENCNDETKETSFDVAQKARIEFENFISDCFNKLLELNSSDSAQVADLEKYLSSDDGSKGKGEKGNPFYGTPTGKYISQEGSSRTTEGEIKPHDPNDDKKNKGNVKVIQDGVFEKDENGDTTGGTGGNNGGGGGTAPGPGDNFGPGHVDGDNGHHKALVPVDWKPVISLKKGYMDIVIYVDHDVDDAELSFEIGRERKAIKKDDNVSIIDCNKGEHNGLTITGVELKGNAKNIIQVAFSDKMSHTLNLGVYETI